MRQVTQADGLRIARRLATYIMNKRLVTASDLEGYAAKPTEQHRQPCRAKPHTPNTFF